MSGNYEKYKVNTASEEQFLRHLGPFIGGGVSRLVFERRDDNQRVIKILKANAPNDQNLIERLLWNAAVSQASGEAQHRLSFEPDGQYIPATELFNTLARVHTVSPCGKYLEMERVNTSVSVDDGDAESGFWGRLGHPIVQRDKSNFGRSLSDGSLKWYDYGRVDLAECLHPLTLWNWHKG